MRVYIFDVLTAAKIILFGVHVFSHIENIVNFIVSYLVHLVYIRELTR
jgi:hypothetical protein